MQQYKSQLKRNINTSDKSGRVFVAPMWENISFSCAHLKQFLYKF